MSVSNSGMSSPTKAGPTNGSGTKGSGDMINANFDNYMQWRYMNTCGRVLPFLEKTLSMRNGGNQFFMGDQMMWCDMMCYCCLEGPYIENQSMFSKYPKLIALRARVASHPKIAAYIKGRCNTKW